MSELHQIGYAKTALWQLGLFGCVSFLAYIARDRMLALLGGFGLCLGFVVPQRPAYNDYSSVEGAFTGALNDLTGHLVFWALVGGGVGIGIASLLARRRKSNRNVANTTSSAAAVR